MERELPNTASVGSSLAPFPGSRRVFKNRSGCRTMEKPFQFFAGGTGRRSRLKPPGHSTMHQEIVTPRQTLKTALRPGMARPSRRMCKIGERALS
jgi:hypothetical protein